MYQPQLPNLPIDTEVRIDEICRLCRSTKGVMSYIFSSVGIDTTIPLSERITSLVNIRMQEGDGLPSLICHRCLYQVEQISEFKTLCEQSDVLLRHFVSFQVLMQMEDEEKKKTSNGENSKSTGMPKSKTVRPNGSASDEDMNGKTGEADSGSENAGDLYQAMDQSDDQNSEDDDDTDENYLTCSTCNKRFTLQEALDRHSLIHTQDGPFPCDYCAALMPDKALLRVHWRQVHAGNKSHMCQTCGEAFHLKENLAKHTARHDRLKPFRCSEPMCNKGFAYRSDLRKHSVIHSGVRPYVCPICLKAFTRSTNLNKHARVHNGSKPFPCAECDKMFATRGDLMRHSMIHTGEKPYSCPICFLSFNRKDKLTRHEKLHTEPQRAHACIECPTSFNRKEDLTKHVQFHHYATICNDEGSNGIKQEKEDSSNSIKENSRDEDTNGLPDDEETATDLRVVRRDDAIRSIDNDQSSSSDTATLDAVIVKEEKVDADEPLELTAKIKTEQLVQGSSEANEEGTTEDVVISVDPSNWDDSSSSNSRLIPQTLIQHQFQCETCRKTFNDAEELSQHVASAHSLGKSRDFICPVCNKGFHQRRELVRHSLTHTGYKPYSCELCGKAFARRDKLTRHMKTHGIERATHGRDLSTCGVCMKSYSSRHNLSRHLLTHTNCKPYQCDMCAAAYSRKDKLVKHIQTVHTI